MPEPAQTTGTSTNAAQEIGALPELASPLSAIEIVASLDALARRGKLPGFHKHDARGGDVLFVLTDFGTPFESILEARATPSGGGSLMRFSTKLKPTMPWVFVAALVVSVWPGVWLTDSMIRTYFASYSDVSFWTTCLWYLPLTILPAPFAFMQAVKKSRRTAHEESLLLIKTIRGVVGDAGAAPS